jgi:hypothetical protein
MRAVGTLSVAVAVIPILFIIWKILRTPLRTWIPLLIALGLFALVQGCVALIDPDAITAIMFLMAGGGKSF